MACATPQPDATPAAVFPAAWAGTWRGAIVPHSAAGPGQPFQMELTIAPTAEPDRWTWTIVYAGAAGNQTRAYELIARDPAQGRWAMDEKNGIVLEAVLLDGALYSWFDVAETRLLVREELLPGGAALAFEVVSAPARGAVTGTADAVVTTLTPTQLQRGRLERVAPPSPPRAP